MIGLNWLKHDLLYSIMGNDYITIFRHFYDLIWLNAVFPIIAGHRIGSIPLPGDRWRVKRDQQRLQLWTKIELKNFLRVNRNMKKRNFSKENNRKNFAKTDFANLEPFSAKKEIWKKKNWKKV